MASEASQPSVSEDQRINDNASMSSEYERVGGSDFPVVRKDPDRPPTIADFASILDEKLVNMASKADINNIVSKVSRSSERLDEIEGRINKIADERYDSGKIRQEIEAFWKRKGEDLPHNDFITGAKNVEQDKARKEKFNYSRRSLHI